MSSPLETMILDAEGQEGLREVRSSLGAWKLVAKTGLKRVAKGRVLWDLSFFPANGEEVRFSLLKRGLEREVPKGEKRRTARRRREYCGGFGAITI